MAKVINMDIVALRSFVLSENLGSFSAAAQALHCSQSALSLRIKKLEEQLDCELFLRNYHNLRLTERGKQLLDEAIKVLKAHDSMLSIAQNSEGNEPIRLGLPEDLTTQFFQNFLARYPQYVDQIELSMDLCKNLIRMIEEDKLDIIIVDAMPDDAGGYNLGARDLTWICSPKFNYQPGQPIPLALHPDGCIFRKHIFKVLDAIGRPYRLVFTGQGAVSVHAAVMAGMGLTINSKGSIPTGMMAVPDDWGLPALGQSEIRVYEKSEPSPALQAFSEVLKKELPQSM